MMWEMFVSVDIQRGQVSERLSTQLLDSMAKLPCMIPCLF